MGYWLSGYQLSYIWWIIMIIISTFQPVTKAVTINDDVEEKAGESQL